MNNLSNDRLAYVIGRLEHVADNVKFGNVGAAQELLHAADGLRELLALREAGKEPVAVVELNDYISAAEALGEVPRRKAVKELYDGALVVGQRLYAAPQLPAVPEYPELLPCPVLLEPGFRFGKGVPTSSMLGALKRRAERQAELDAMSPEAKAEYDASIDKLKSVLMPDGAEQRLAAAVELLKQAAPHMLADESMKDPGGALCGKMPDLHDDTRRMDWLCSMVVDVREPLVYGSHSIFWSQCDSADDEQHHTTLREQIDAAIAAATKPEVKS